MTIEVLICHPTGAQRLEQRQVPDNWFQPEEEKEEKK